MAADSFRLESVPRDIYESTLKSMVIWCPNQLYRVWCVSLCCEPFVRGMVCIQIRINENKTIVDPAPYGPLGLARATTTSFTVSDSVVSSAHAGQIIELNFVHGINFRFSDFIGMLRYQMLGYQLAEDGSGTQGWVLLVVDMLINRNRLYSNSRSLLRQAIHTLRTTNFHANINIPDPIPFGVVYRV